MRILTAALMVLLALFAGCLEGDDADDNGTGTPVSGNDPAGSEGSGSSGDSGSTGGSDGSDGNPDSGVSNNAPTVSLTTATSSGEPPLDVTFSFDASDDDGDIIDWTFDADGDGTPEVSGTEVALPGEYTHTYESAGNFTAAFEATDGMETVSTTLSVVVAALDGEAPAAPAPLQEFQASWVASTPIDCLVLGVEDGVTYASMDVEGSTIGKAYTTEVTSGGGESAFGGISWFGAGAAYIGDTDMASGTVPSGAVSADFFSCGEAQVSVHYIVPA